MSSSNTNITEAIIIQQSMIIFARTWCSLIIGLGVIGHTSSLYVFTRPLFRSSPCSWYFLASTISGISVVVITIPLRLFQAGYNINILANSLVTCKAITLLLQWTRAQNAWFIALASVDRFLCSSTSANLRALSSLHVARRIILLAILVVGIVYIHIPICFQINTRQQTCIPMPGIYQTFYGAWNLIVYSVGPPIIMLYFGLRTVQNIRQSIRRIGKNTIAVENQPRHRKITDRQLIQMMLVQCLIFILTASLPSIQFIYTSVRSNIIIDALQSAKDNLFYNVAGLISLTVPCLSFYLFILSSKLFRSEFIKLFNTKWTNRPTAVTGQITL
ncbi:hypothetical protein I4U23_004685 [Adineta vaga]|nr:hypothetical protein I4U23_004685 [Adineta vaga]